MYYSLIVGIIAAFAGLLFINLYFRAKVLRSYRYLVQNRVDFSTKHLFNRKKMEAEVLPRFPEHRQHIEQFANHIRYSVWMASLLICVIIFFGLVLKYYR